MWESEGPLRINDQRINVATPAGGNKAINSCSLELHCCLVFKLHSGKKKLFGHMNKLMNGVDLFPSDTHTTVLRKLIVL